MRGDTHSATIAGIEQEKKKRLCVYILAVYSSIIIDLLTLRCSVIALFFFDGLFLFLDLFLFFSCWATARDNNMRRSSTTQNSSERSL